MKFKSHYAVGNYIYEYITSEMNFELDKQHFLRGTVLPDLLIAERKYVHDYDRTLTFFKELLSEIETTTYSISEISIKLGMLTHYLCDAFCVAHNHFHHNVIRHTYYEWKMNRLVKSYSFPQQIKSDITNKLVDVDQNTDTLLSLFETTHQQYINDVDNNLRENLLRDLHVSAATASAIIVTLLEKVTVEVDVKEPILA